MNSAHVVAGARSPTIFPRKGVAYASPLRPIIDLFVALAFSVELRDLRASRRGSSKVAHARQVSMYLAHVACSLSLTDVGILYARDRSTVAHACCVIEDQRDDPELDLKLDHLERAIVGLVNALAWHPGSR